MTKEQMKNKMADIAVNWWIDKIGGSHNVGDGLANAMLNFTSNNVKNPEENNIEKFREIFLKRFKERYDKNPHFDFSVDYSPEGMLSEICHESGIDGSKLPCKSVLTVNEKEMSARCGYQSQWDKLADFRTLKEKLIQKNKNITHSSVCLNLYINKEKLDNVMIEYCLKSIIESVQAIKDMIKE